MKRINDRVGVQVNVPMIYRSFRCVKDGVIETGDTSGLVDGFVRVRAGVTWRF